MAEDKLFEFFNKFREKDYVTIRERKTKKEFEVCTELPAGIAFYLGENMDEIRTILTDIQEAYKEKSTPEKAVKKIVKKSYFGKGLDFVFNLLSEILMNDFDFMDSEWVKKNLGLRYAVELVFTFAAEVVATFNDLGGQDLIGAAVAKAKDEN